jgi:hypothetical protein
MAGRASVPLPSRLHQLRDLEERLRGLESRFPGTFSRSAVPPATGGPDAPDAQFLEWALLRAEEAHLLQLLHLERHRAPLRRLRGGNRPV